MIVSPSALPPTIVRRYDYLTETIIAQGDDGQSLRKKMNDAFRQFAARTIDDGIAIEVPEGYRHVPLTQAGTIKVRFLAPRPIQPSNIDRFGMSDD